MNVIATDCETYMRLLVEGRVDTNTSPQLQQAILNAVDQNGNGEIDIEDVIIMGLKVPGIRINRANFLQSELQKNYPQEVIDDAIAHNPLHANIPQEAIDRIANEVIKYERACVSGISAALGAPGGIAMAATIPIGHRRINSFVLEFYSLIFCVCFCQF